jgi:hypothetical protein
VKQRRSSWTGFFCQKKRRKRNMGVLLLLLHIKLNKQPAIVEGVLSTYLEGKKRSRGGE